ncbi:MAG: 50S ribosomal protein L6 [Patescibacteria group bacterium]|nr:50S ribosomal protein L6 [Patescibacteria group bacterium]
MSRIGKLPISIPNGVDVKIDKRKLTVKSQKGELVYEFRPEIEVKIENQEVLVLPKIKTKQTKAFWGLTRALIANMIEGALNGYEKKLELQGVGYKVEAQGEDLIMQIGFSHPVKIDKVDNIKFVVEKNIITISGIDKQLVGQVASKIRKIRPPEPYKGKGIRYVGEVVRRKAGKKAAGSE